MKLNPGNAGKNRDMRTFVREHVKPQIKAGIMMARDPERAEAIGGRPKKKRIDWSKARA